MMVVPQERMVVVAFGSADGSIRCPNGTHEQFTWEQSLRLSQVWNMVQRAIATNKTNTAGAESSYREHRTSDTSYISDVELDRLLHSPGAPSRSPSPTRPAAESSHSSPSSPTAAASIAGSPAPRGGVAGGACYCYCPGGQAIGKCGHAANATECESRYGITQRTLAKHAHRTRHAAHTAHITRHTGARGTPPPFQLYMMCRRRLEVKVGSGLSRRVALMPMCCCI